MNKTLNIIGKTATAIAIMIKWSAIWITVYDLVMLPVLFYLFMYVGKVPPDLIENPLLLKGIQTYLCFLSVGIFTILIELIQKKYVSKIKIHEVKRKW